MRTNLTEREECKKGRKKMSEYRATAVKLTKTLFAEKSAETSRRFWLLPLTDLEIKEAQLSDPRLQSSNVRIKVRNVHLGWLSA